MLLLIIIVNEQWKKWGLFAVGYSEKMQITQGMTL